MDVLHGRIAAIDIGKKGLVVCVRLPTAHPDGERRQEVRTFGTTTRDLPELRDYLTGAQVTTVTMEATGQYWRGAFYLLEEPMETILVTLHTSRAYRGARPMCWTRSGCASWPSAAWSKHRSCRRPRSGSCGI